MTAMSQMELDFSRKFRAKITQGAIDIVELCRMGKVDPRAAPAIIATECLSMAVRMTVNATDMPLEVWLGQCRAVFEAAKREEEAES